MDTSGGVLRGMLVLCAGGGDVGAARVALGVRRAGHCGRCFGSFEYGLNTFQQRC